MGELDQMTPKGSYSTGFIRRKMASLMTGLHLYLCMCHCVSFSLHFSYKVSIFKSFNTKILLRVWVYVVILILSLSLLGCLLFHFVLSSPLFPFAILLKTLNVLLSYIYLTLFIFLSLRLSLPSFFLSISSFPPSSHSLTPKPWSQISPVSLICYDPYRHCLVLLRLHQIEDKNTIWALQPSLLIS